MDFGEEHYCCIALVLYLPHGLKMEYNFMIFQNYEMIRKIRDKSLLESWGTTFLID